MAPPYRQRTAQIVGRTGDEIAARLKAKKRNAEIAKNDREKLQKFIKDLMHDFENARQKGSYTWWNYLTMKLNLFETACKMGMVKENIFRRPTHMQKMAITQVYILKSPCRV